MVQLTKLFMLTSQTYQPPNAGFPTDSTSNTPYAGAAPNTPTYTPPSTISSAQLTPTAAPNFQAPQQTPLYPTVSLAPQPLQPTEQNAQNTSTDLQKLNDQLLGKSAFTSDLYKQYGFNTTTDANGNIVADPGTADLSAKLTGLTNEAQAIPLQIQNNAIGHDVTSGELQPVTTAKLRNNAIQALGVSSLIAAKNGQLATAQHYVDNAVQQKYGPIEEQIKAKTANLQLIQNSPQYDAETKARAAQQQAALTQQSAALDIAKANYTATQNEVLKYAPVADAQTLSAMQSATTPQQVTQIAAQAGYQQPDSGRYKDSVTTTTDAFGNSVQHVRIFDTITGQFINNAPAGATAASLNSSSSNNGSTGPSSSPPTSSTTGTNANGVSYAQYGLLANTDFNPKNQVDQLADTYLNKYLKSGTVPAASTLGRGIKPGAFSAVEQRANELYFKATGTNLPDARIIQGNQTLIAGNNKLLNNLKVQEGTIAANSKLLLNNLNGANLNQNVPLINGIIDGIRNSLGDPDVASYLAQNTTVSNELGSLLALKNASGTTVHDKLEAAGLISKNDNANQIAAVVRTLMQEAQNAHTAISNATGDLYQQTDPLQQDANNPARTQTQFGQTKAGKPFDYQSAKAAGYTDAEIKDYIANN